MGKDPENGIFARFHSIDMAELANINVYFITAFLHTYKLSNKFNWYYALSVTEVQKEPGKLVLYSSHFGLIVVED